MVVRFVNLKREIAAFQKHFNTTVSAVPRSHYSAHRPVGKNHRGLEGKLLTSWDAPLVNDFFAMIFGLLARSVAVSFHHCRTMNYWCIQVESSAPNRRD